MSELLAGVPLLDGRPDLPELERIMRRRTVQAGQPLWGPGDAPRGGGFVGPRAVSRALTLPGGQAGQLLWRQGDAAREVLFVVHGAVSASLTVPGDRTVELGSAGPGDVLGEIALLDGQGHTMTARVTETATVLALARPDFTALLA